MNSANPTATSKSSVKHKVRLELKTLNSRLFHLVFIFGINLELLPCSSLVRT